MKKEIEDHEYGDYQDITAYENIKKDVHGNKHKPVMAVWACKRKQNLFGQITKYKSRINFL